MSYRFRRILYRRRIEIVITIALLALCISLIIIAIGPPPNTLSVQLGEKLAFAIAVALVVRWLSVIFAEAEESADSDHLEYHEAIKNARNRIWICQTWLPGIERDASEILQTGAHNIRLLVASFAPASPIHARIAGRRLKESTAKTNIASSVRPFVVNRRDDCVKFNHGHHPGWIAVVDSRVFWGPTPVHVDNQSVDFLFHKHSTKSAQGAFWTAQFQMLWDHHSHILKDELPYNTELQDVVELAERRLSTPAPSRASSE